jgi:hypothetical protein
MSLTKQEKAIESLLPKIRSAHSKMVETGQTTIELARDIGEMLWVLKENTTHGEWTKLVEDRCEFSIKSAQTYMKVSAGWEKIKKQDATPATIEGCVKLLKGPPKKKGKQQPPLVSPPPGDEVVEVTIGETVAVAAAPAWSPPEGVRTYKDSFDVQEIASMKPANGKPKGFDDQEVKQMFARLVRRLDDRTDACGNAGYGEGCKELLGKSFEMFLKWSGMKR